jgi:hypothetical protein
MRVAMDPIRVARVAMPKCGKALGERSAAIE